MRGWLWLLGASMVLAAADRELRLVTVDPAHFHAAQLHTGPIAGFARDAWLYAPVGKDLAAHWNALAGLQARSAVPNHWRHHVYAGDDFFSRMLAEQRTGRSAADTVIFLSGRNSRKSEYLAASVDADLHVLADKPWIIEAEDFGKLEQVLAAADKQGVIVYDCMTQRFDIAYQLQRELVNDPEVFGERLPGTPQQPAVRMASAHFLLKRFNGVANLRPAWYFDIRQQGEALADVGTHVVDLAHWTLFPEQALDYRKDLQILSARRWPTVLSLDQFRGVTGEREFPEYLRSAVRDGQLHYYTNNSVLYTVRGLHVQLDVTWEYESPSGDRDCMLAVYHGGRSKVIVSQGKGEKYLPEVYVRPHTDASMVRAALERRLAQLADRWRGLRVSEEHGQLKIVIPQALRIPDIDYFLLLADRFAGYVRAPGTLPKWEKDNMLVKYWLTTQAVKKARETK